MVSAMPRVFSIASGSPFLTTLASSLLNGRIIAGWPDRDNPLALSEATIYLPTRRAARAFADALASAAAREAMLLPRIIPLGGLEDAEDRLIFERGVESGAFDTDLLPDIDPIHRRLVLTRLVVEWSRQIATTLKDGTSHLGARLEAGWRDDPQGFIVAATPHDAVDLADALATLIDTLVIHDKTWTDLHNLVPTENDEYWRISRNFLEIAASAWPMLKSAEGVMDLAERRHRLALREAARLRDERPLTPILAAGSTGSMPATAALLAAIARLPRGAVILPDLDQGLDDPSFAALTTAQGRIAEPSHPQAQLAHLLKQIGIERHDVMKLGEEDRQAAARMSLLSEVMRPAETTDLWKAPEQRVTSAVIDDALIGVSVIEADHEREEALAIALALRETLETPDRTAALITPDRALAQRVSAELKRWSIDAADSAGLPLKQSEAGRLAAHLADVIATDFDPVALIALLDHPAVRLGLDDDIYLRGCKTLDLAVLRTPFRGIGLAGLQAALQTERASDRQRRLPVPRQRLTALDFDAAERVLAAFEPLTTDLAQAGRDLAHQLRAHADAVMKVAARADDAAAFERLEGAAELQDLIQSAAPVSSGLIEAGAADLPPFLDRMMRGITLQHSVRSHPRLAIFGLLEARLIRPDRVILAGLDETIWPPQTRSDPFLTRPARDALGLPSPERRIGQTAHDFVSALGIKDAIITRSAKRGGQPMVASRFLQRLRALVGETHFKSLTARGDAYLDLARIIDFAPPAPQLKQPQPVPPRSRLPRRLSVTAIETMRRDPYSIYAKHVLRLDPLDPIGRDIGPADLGTMTHDAIGLFTQTHPLHLPDDALEQLLACGRHFFAPLIGRPDFEAFWWPRFIKTAQWVIDWEHKRRDTLAAPLAVECSGQIEIPLEPDDTFRLTARADRIETLRDGTLALIDFKTGQPPSAKQVRAGVAPQLTLEAAMARHNGFEQLTAKEASLLVYVKLGGARHGKEIFIRPDTGTLQDMIDSHFAEFKSMIEAHWLKGHPFLSRPVAEYAKRFGDYDHLARVKEWSLGGEEGGGEE